MFSENDATNVNIENQLLQMHEGGGYEYHELQEAVVGGVAVEGDSAEVPEIAEITENSDWTVPIDIAEPEPSVKDKWSDEEVKRLLVFFIDNKDTFTSGTTKKKHLWAVACKTMLIGKTPQTCEVKLRNLKRKYSMMLLEHQKGMSITWPLFEQCHQAFHNDTYVQFMLKEQSEQEQKLAKVPIPRSAEDANGGVIVVKNVNVKPTGGDSSVELMLTLYLRYKKNFQKDYWRRGLWETIAMELGEEDSDYWHKRFMNFKQHYLRMVDKREAEGPDSINWPYMNLFDQIFENDPEFQKRYVGNKVSQEPVAAPTESVTVYNEWNDTEVMILVKYCFDCFDEFQDSTIPNNFLWTEVGRLLDKKPEACKKKYGELKQAHLQKYLDGGYTLRDRNALAILFDNIISREVEVELNADKLKKGDIWQTDDIDELVKFLYENIEMFKDPVCYYVCWSGIANKLDKSVQSCKKRWEDLKVLYQSILDDKKENPDMQIDWRYIELFDRIFDYGMDTNLLSDFKQLKEQNMKPTSHSIGGNYIIY